jgi:hypothetical protein
VSIGGNYKFSIDSIFEVEIFLDDVILLEEIELISVKSEELYAIFICSSLGNLDTKVNEWLVGKFKLTILFFFLKDLNLKFILVLSNLWLVSLLFEVTNQFI